MSFPGWSTARREWRLRSSLMLLLVVATMGVFGPIGFGVLAYRVPTVLEEERHQARCHALHVACAGLAVPEHIIEHEVGRQAAHAVDKFLMGATDLPR